MGALTRNRAAHCITAAYPAPGVWARARVSVVRTRVCPCARVVVIGLGRCLAASASGRAIGSTGEYCDDPAFHAASKLRTDLLSEKGLPSRNVVCGVKAATSAGAALLSGLQM
jgi:hypothetical protein